jgi:hypothetical protein
MIDFASPAPRRSRRGRTPNALRTALTTSEQSTSAAERVGLALLSTGSALLVVVVTTGMFLLCGFSLQSHNLSFWIGADQ